MIKKGNKIVVAKTTQTTVITVGCFFSFRIKNWILNSY